MKNDTPALHVQSMVGVRGSGSLLAGAGTRQSRAVAGRGDGARLGVARGLAVARGAAVAAGFAARAGAGAGTGAGRRDGLGDGTGTSWAIGVRGVRTSTRSRWMPRACASRSTASAA